MNTLQSEVRDLTHEGYGICKVEDRVYFVDGALPGEQIEFKPLKKRKGVFYGELVEILQSSPDRVKPECEYFGVCGGCALQHLSRPAQVALKGKMLFDSLQRIGKVDAEQRIAPLVGEDWHYRRKARPGIKLVPKKGGILVGFRERRSSFITSLRACLTLDKSLSDLLNPLHTLIDGLSENHRIPQIEMAVGDNATAFILRHLEPLNADDLRQLTNFAKDHGIQFFLQPGKLDSIHPLFPENPEPLHFELKKFDVKLVFAPTDFIQVNGPVNEAMVEQALALLGPQQNDRILDLFCGLGNFTLPLAKSGASVMGVEGDRELVRKGDLNARSNGLDIEFRQLDLHKADDVATLEQQSFNKMLIDPPRSGAKDVCESLIPKLMPEKLLYVSCNPATLARDSGYLVNDHGYRLTHAGIIDMFPHTAHVESMALFEK